MFSFYKVLVHSFDWKGILNVCPIMQHKNQIVNEELWSEIKTYGDIELMPFVDYYGLITWKTVAICIFGVSYYSHIFFLIVLPS